MQLGLTLYHPSSRNPQFVCLLGHSYRWVGEDVPTAKYCRFGGVGVALLSREACLAGLVLRCFSVPSDSIQLPADMSRVPVVLMDERSAIANVVPPAGSLTTARGANGATHSVLSAVRLCGSLRPPERVSNFSIASRWMAFTVCLAIRHSRRFCACLCSPLPSFFLVVTQVNQFRIVCRCLCACVFDWSHNTNTGIGEPCSV